MIPEDRDVIYARLRRYRMCASVPPKPDPELVRRCVEASMRMVDSFPPRPAPPAEDLELGSPPFTPKSLEAFRARNYRRENRR